ncbi:MAG: CRISPR-associated protein Cas4 [Oscillospiraceae bacterium]|nr:CRISPR-associated protein Cas4 [Oscillospiraceae bacterium]
MYTEDDFLQLSGIQHFAFCRRQWALIHIEQLWAENVLTAEGRVIHEKAHDPFFAEKRGDVIITREMPIHSSELGVSGQCDIIEFHQDDVCGVSLHGRSGKWFPLIVEYKRGKSKINDCDRFQLTLQAMCLEEMLNCGKIEKSCIYYGETKRREYVDITDEMREKARKMVCEMHDYYNRRYTPKVKSSKYCLKCSLYELCLPKVTDTKNVANYIAHALREEGVF